MDSWWRWLFWHCSYCFCKCDAPGPDSDRYWSLKDVTADIESNKIISGIRFVKKNRVIQIEIEQITALPEGVREIQIEIEQTIALPEILFLLKFDISTDNQ